MADPIAPADLLDAIRASPEDDAPWLACAAWLENHGDAPRAEFLRLSVESDQVPPLSPRQQALNRRSRELQRDHGKTWAVDLPSLDGITWSLGRGLFEHATFNSYTAFQKHHETVFRRPVFSISFNTLRAPARLFASPTLAHVRALKLHNCPLDEDAVLQLLACPHLSGLASLSLAGSSVGNTALRALAATSSMANLRSLTIHGDTRGGRLDPASWDALGRSPYVTRLKTLDLAGARMGEDGARALFASPNLAELRRLNLGNCAIGARGLDGLGDGERLRSLERLHVNSNHLGDEGVGYLAAARRMDRLRVLSLDSNLIGNEGLRRLADARHLRGLLSLDLGHNAISGPGLIALIDGGAVPALEGLNLAGTLIGDDGLAALGRTKALPNLRTVEAYNVPARRELTAAVIERFRDGKKPIREKAVAAPVPAPVTVTVAAPTGRADEDGLLEAIIAAPEDDLPRLVYADWLEEHGDADRAALIRLSCAPAPGEQAKALEKRCTPAIPKELAETVHWVRFDRGLLEARVQMRGLLTKAFQAAGPPWLKSIRLFRLLISGETKDWSKVANMPLLAQVRMLKVGHNSLKKEGLAALVASPHVAGLFGLDLSGNQLSYGRRLLPLLQAGTLPRLCYLSLADNYLNTDTMRLLAGWRPARKLAALDLRGNWVGAGGVSLLVGSELVSELTQLNLRNNYLPDQAIHALVESPHLNRLTHLWLRNNSITDAGLQALTGSKLLGRLQRLDVSHNRFSGDAAVALALSPNLSPTCRVHLYIGNYQEAAKVRLREALGARLVLT